MSVRNKLAVVVSLVSVFVIGSIDTGTAVAAGARPVSTAIDTPWHPIPVVSEFNDKTERDVWSMVEAGGKLYVCGNFDTVILPSGQSVKRDSVFAFELHGANKGELSNFKPQIRDGNGRATIYSCSVSYNGKSLIVAGDFNAVDGTNVGNITMINLADGKRNPKFNATTNGKVTDVERVRGRYMLFGSFTQVSGQAQTGIATVKKSGAFDPYFSSKLAGQISPSAGPTKSFRGAVRPDGKEMVAVVNTSHIDGKKRRHLAKWTLGKNSASLQNWRPPKTMNTKCNNTYASVRDVTYSGNKFFYTVASGGPCTPSVSDQAIKWRSSDRGSKVQPVWFNRTCNDTQWSVAVKRGVLYQAGHMKCVEKKPGGAKDYVDRMGAAALSAKTGKALAWRSDQPRCEGGKVLYFAGGYLWAGTDCGNGLHARKAQ